ncbi:MAG: hypothetical protein A2X49_10480 [Lentisphaerae bacterium GWF2_52_8]|nr:MAG: hypothetical protein A2X49_10480 [Lentisphaerae bacterium GWF2_52_8]
MDINNIGKFLDKIKKSELAVGMVVTLSDPAVSELAGDAGYDFTWIDMEHAPLNIETVHAHIMALRGTNAAPFVRVTWNEHGVIKPVLDLAPAAVIIPMVNSAEAAEAAVSACRYPPKGTRGCGVRRAVRYGVTPFGDYLKASESEPLVIVQIEHIDAVRNLDAILKVPGIDSICIGPCDLSGSMGKLNQLDDPELNRVIDEICLKTRKANIILGSATGYSQQIFDKWRKRGLQWTAISGDCGCIFAQSRQLIADAKKHDN